MEKTYTISANGSEVELRRLRSGECRVIDLEAGQMLASIDSSVPWSVAKDVTNQFAQHYLFNTVEGNRG